MDANKATKQQPQHHHADEKEVVDSKKVINIF